MVVNPPGANFEVNSMDKQLTILITCYNKEQYVSYVLRQLIDQNCDALDIHIINDKSTDASLEIIQEIVNGVDNITIHTLDNHFGIGYVRKFALSLVKTKYFIFIDADDMIAEDYVETILQAISADTADIYHFLARAYPYGNIICLSHTLWDKVFAIDFIRKNKIDFNETLCYNEDIDFRQQIEQYAFEEKHYQKIIYTYNLYTTNSITHTSPLWYQYNDEGIKEEVMSS